MKKFSILFALIMVFAVLFGTISNAADDEEKTYSDGYDEGYDEGYQAGKNSAKSRTPVIRIKETLETPSVEAGDEFDLKVTFYNDSNYPAYSVAVTPQIDESAVLVYERPLIYRAEQIYKKDELNVTFHLKTNPDSKTGTFPLKFKMEYKNTLGEMFTRDDTSYFKVESSKSKPILNVENVRFSEDVLKYGETFDLFFDIYNMGETTAKEVEVKLSGFEANTIFPVDSNDYSYVGDLEARSRGSKSVTTQNFAFRISPEITVKETNIKATITYKNADGKDASIEKTFYLTGITPKPKESGEEEEKKKDDKKYAKPKMIISSYSLNPRNITAGDEFTFSFTFKNTSKEKDLRNIKVSINSFEGSLLISKGSNTFYIEKMDRNSSLSRSIDLLAKQDLKSTSYELYVTFEYEDYDGEEYTAKESINVPVTEYSKLVINSATASETYVNNQTSLSFEYVNMGKATISNLVARIKSDTITPAQESSYVGNIQNGSSDYYDIEITPTEVGKNVGTLILSFEDSSGKTFEVTRDFEVIAMEEVIPEMDYEDMPDEGDMIEDEDGNKFAIWQIVLAGIGAFLVALLLGKFITKKILMRKFENDI